MPDLKQIQQEIQALPEEAQLLLIDFIEILKKRYPQSDQLEANESNLSRRKLEPFDQWEAAVLELGQPCQVSLPHEALSNGSPL
ncbi:MAG: hypothetical protein ACKO7W_05990 [Elainella sp.]